MQRAADLLFNYLSDVLYTPATAKLNLEDLPSEMQQLGQGLLYIAGSMQEARDFSKALARGDLSAEPPSRNNELAAPLKSLQASLRHMTWQSQQVAKGDYQQHLNFLGEFAEAFNTMTHQLDLRQRALEAEIESGRRKTLALEQNNSLFEAITSKSSLWIFVVGRQTREQLFVNNAAQEALKKDGKWSQSLIGWLEELDLSQVASQELSFKNGRSTIHLAVNTYPIQWRQQEANAYVLQDVSAEIKQVRLLENAAYQDNLTKLYNRSFGMDELHKRLKKNELFSICFVDIDNLKYVNDNLGHSEGDKYIISVAHMLRSFSKQAVVSRIGGDEFMLLAPGKNQKETETRMKLLRSRIIKSGESVQTPYYRSISYGVVEVLPDCKIPASDLLGIADERMYTFKREHKDQRQTMAT